MDGRTILVVEDDAGTREALAEILRLHGYEVATAEDGQQALDRLREGAQPGLILLDMLMPVLDGWGFLDRLRGWSPDAEPPVIVITGSHLAREWAGQRGCAGFLRKPVDPEELLAEVQRCLTT